MDFEIACDHNDHDHYADDVKDIHCFTPIEITLGVHRPWSLFNDCRDCDLGLSKSAHRARSGEPDELAISLPNFVHHRLCGGSNKLRWGGRPFGRVRDDILIASARRMHQSCSRASETWSSARADASSKAASGATSRNCGPSCAPVAAIGCCQPSSRLDARHNHPPRRGRVGLRRSLARQ